MWIVTFQPNLELLEHGRPILPFHTDTGKLENKLMHIPGFIINKKGTINKRICIYFNVIGSVWCMVSFRILIIFYNIFNT